MPRPESPAPGRGDPAGQLPLRRGIPRRQQAAPVRLPRARHPAGRHVRHRAPPAAPGVRLVDPGHLHHRARRARDPRASAGRRLRRVLSQDRPRPGRAPGHPPRGEPEGRSKLDEDHPRRRSGRQPAGSARVRPVVLRRLERPVRPLPDRHRLLPAQRRHRPPLQRPAGLRGRQPREGPRRQRRTRTRSGSTRIWRVGRRHQLEAGLHQAQPRPGRLHARSATSPGAARPTTPGSRRPRRRPAPTSLGGYYRFAAYRNERFEIGPTIGVGYLSDAAPASGPRAPSRGPADREPLARPEREHRQRHGRHRRLRERLVHEAPRRARRTTSTSR